MQLARPEFSRGSALYSLSTWKRVNFAGKQDIKCNALSSAYKLNSASFSIEKHRVVYTRSKSLLELWVTTFLPD